MRCYGHTLGYFPSVAAAWRVNDEAFLADNKVVSDLKLRLRDVYKRQLNYFIRILLTIKIKRYYGCKYG